jgi:hypothetical protein
LLLVNLDADAGLSTLVDDLEGEVLDVILDRLVVELLTDETLLRRLSVNCKSSPIERATYDVENGVVGVAGELVLGGVTNEALLVGESDPGRCDTVTCRGHLSIAIRSRRAAANLPWSLTMISTFPPFIIPTQE